MTLKESHHADSYFSAGKQYHFIRPPSSSQKHPPPSFHVRRSPRTVMVEEHASIFLPWCQRVTPALSTLFVAMREQLTTILLPPPVVENRLCHLNGLSVSSFDLLAAYSCKNTITSH
jgi:hypothetical protein